MHTKSAYKQSYQPDDFWQPLIKPFSATQLDFIVSSDRKTLISLFHVQLISRVSIKWFYPTSAKVSGWKAFKIKSVFGYLEEYDLRRIFPDLEAGLNELRFSSGCKFSCWRNWLVVPISFLNTQHHTHSFGTAPNFLFWQQTPYFSTNRLGRLAYTLLKRFHASHPVWYVRGGSNGMLVVITLTMV